jgi:hypothetical protein
MLFIVGFTNFGSGNKSTKASATGNGGINIKE